MHSMMSEEKIYSGKKLVAIIFRKDIKVSGLKFFTDSRNPFQIGIHNRPKGLKLKPHFHKLEKPLVIDTIQEILMVQKGKIKVSLFSTSAKMLAQKILKAGDSILLISGGHGVEFLNQSIIFEIKQGPYPGSKVAKRYITK